MRPGEEFGEDNGACDRFNPQAVVLDAADDRAGIPRLVLRLSFGLVGTSSCALSASFG